MLQIILRQLRAKTIACLRGKIKSLQHKSGLDPIPNTKSKLAVM